MFQTSAKEIMLMIISHRDTACHTGDIQAINAGSPDMHVNLQYEK